MAKFKFPRNPNADRENPFEDEHGANPFGDDAAPATNPESVTHPDENPYGAESSAAQPYKPGDYETFLPHRGAMVWRLGLIGFALQLLAVMVAFVSIVWIDEFAEGMAYGLPWQLIGLVVCIPAWIMGQMDLRAIAAGAMEKEGRRATRWGLLLGIIGTLLGAIQLFAFFGLVVFETFFG